MFRVSVWVVVFLMALTGCNEDERTNWGPVETRLQSLKERLNSVTTMMSKLDSAQNASHEELVQKVGTLEARLGALERMLRKHPLRKKGAGVPSADSRALASSNEVLASKISTDPTGEVKVHASVWAKLQENPGILLWGFRLVPHHVNGKNQGFKVIGVRSGSVPASLGFQTGDVLLTVNGKAPVSTEKNESILGALFKPGGGTVTVERKGKKVTWSLKTVGAAKAAAPAGKSSSAPASVKESGKNK